MENIFDQTKNLEKTQIFKDYTAFMHRSNRHQNGVSREFAEEHENWKEMNESNVGCWNCKECDECKGCASCSYCTKCVYCVTCAGCERCGYCDNCVECEKCRDCFNQKSLNSVLGKEDDSKKCVCLIKK